jgi:ribulose-phosphate 3-epimerase
MKSQLLDGKVAPSVLAANVLDFLNELRDVEAAGAGVHHFDVMDGHFVPNLSFGLPILAEFKKHSQLPLDVHIMVSNPDETALQYVDHGADVLVFHIEAARHPHRIVQALHDRGVLAGVALNPGTPAAAIKEMLRVVDVVNVMSVNPGFSGQKFIASTPYKIREIVGYLQEVGRLDDVVIEVDGGIDANTAKLVCQEGASLLVAGSYVYGTSHRKDRISALMDALKR